MRSTDTHFKHPSFIRRHELTGRTNMPRSFSRLFDRIWFINSEEHVTENLNIAYDIIDECIDPENLVAFMEVADEVDVAVLNTFLVQIVSNAEEFMSPHQVACLTALILASYQDGPTRISTLEAAQNELVLWQQEYDPAAQIQKGIRKAKFAARTASEIARKAADENFKAEYIAVINRVAAVAQKAADSAEKFRRFVEEDFGDAESRREAAQEVTKAVKISEKAADIARDLLKVNHNVVGKSYLVERYFFEAEQDFLRIHEA